MDYNIDTALPPTMTMDTGVASLQPPSDAVAQTRSYKAHMGLGDTIKQDYDQILRAISTGQEQTLRESAALDITAEALKTRQQDLVELAAKKGPNLTLNDIAAHEVPPANPKSVIEDAYSRAYVNTIKDAADRNEDNIFTTAQAQDPLAIAAYLNKGSDILSKREYAVTQAQNLQPAVDSNKWYSFKDAPSREYPEGYEHSFSPEDLKQWASLGFRNEFMLRGVADKTPRLKGGLLGENIEEQIKEILGLTKDKYIDKIDQIKATLSPELAQRFISYIADFSTREKQLEDAFSAAQLAVSISGMGAAKSSLNAIGAQQAKNAGRRANAANYRGDLREGPDGVMRPGGAGPNEPPPGGGGAVAELTNQQASKAVQDVVKAAAAPEVSKASIAEGAGDVKEAAIQKAIVSVTRPDPSKEATDTLLSMHRVDTEANKNSPGNLSREEHTRLLDDAARFDNNTSNLLNDSARVMRVPALAEYGFRSIADRVSNYFPGRENTIMDINVRYEPVTNTHHYDIQIGNYGAVPFSSRDLAIKHAELNGYPLTALEGKGEDRVYLPPAAFQKTEAFDTFYTAKGSEYEVHEDGTTTRNKKLRPEHPGDEGPKPRSSTTRYITEEQYNAIRKNEPLPGTYKKEPAIGLMPVEWLPDGKIHFGNKITGFGTGARKNVVHPDFDVQRLPDGSFRFLNKDGIEIDTHPDPAPGLMPYNLKTNKFEPVITGETVTVKQQGLGFYLVVTKPVNETEPFVRNALITDRTKSISNEGTSRLTSVGNAILGYVRSPYDTLGDAHNENRAKVVFGQSKFIDVIKQEMKDIEDIYKGMLGDRNVVIEKPLSYFGSVTGRNKIIAADFTRALEASQTLPDPKTNLPGYYMKTPAEIQHFWETVFRRPATLKEQAAYLAVGRIGYFDHILRSVEQYKFKARVGVERWSFHTSKDGALEHSPWVEGVQTKIVNASKDELTLIHDADGTERYFHSLGVDAQAAFREDVKQGRYLGIELWDPEKRPIQRQPDIGHNGGPRLNDLDDLRIRYVFSNSFKREPMTLDQIGYRGGGHWQYDYEHSVKQPIVRTQYVGGKLQHIYEGDTTHSFVSTRAQGEQFATAMNEVARLIKARQYKDARNYAKTVFDQEWKDIYNGFRPSVNPQTSEKTPARFSTDPRQKFRVVPQGKTIHNLDDKLAAEYRRTNPTQGNEVNTFVDGTRHGSLARSFQTEYVQPRESYALSESVNIGSPDKPFYQFRPAKLTDPIATMLRAVNRITNSTYMNDEKISAVEHWLQENKGVIDATLAEIRGSPFYYFNEGKFKLNTYNALQIASAKTNRYKIQQLLGTPSTIDTAVHAVKQAMSDYRYEASTKTQKAVRAPLIAPEWILDHLNHPVDFLRGMTYHLSLGLFVPKQMVVQSMAYTTIYGIAGPVRATQGSYAALMYQWSRVNKSLGIITEMDKRATLFGWKLGEYSEAVRLMDRSGFGTIGNEISLDNGLHKQTYMVGDVKSFARAGQVFFNEGNLHVRFGSYFTAYKEFRAANPLMKIGPIEEGQILKRANVLNATMTRDANTVLNKGLIGVPFQFFDYMKKMADVFWGKNIGENFQEKLIKGEDGTYRPGSDNTAKKRALIRLRMYAMYSMLGGAVGALGVSGLPFGDTIRKHAIAGDLPFQTAPYVKGDQAWSTMLMEGPTSYLIYELTGRFYNINNRYNPNGLQIVRDAMQSDPNFWKVLLGAVGTTVGKELASLSGFTNALYSMVEGDPAKEAWPLKQDDWLAPLRNAASWSDAEKLLYAVSYHKWLDSHGRPTSDVSVTDAIFRTLSGLNDQNIDDMYLQKLIEKDRKAIYQKAENEFHEQHRHAELAASNNNPEQAKDFMKRAMFALTSRNVPTEMYAKIFYRAATDNTDSIAANDEKFWTQYVPENMKDASMQAFKRIQELKKNK